MSNFKSSLADNLHAIQSDCRYERETPLNTFHCYDVTGGYFDRCVKQAEQLEQRYEQLAEVARELYKRTLVAYGGEDVSIVEIDDYRKRLEELGVEL